MGEQRTGDRPEVRSKRGIGSIVGGLVLVLIGVPMLVCPGPGIASIATGAAMIAGGLGLKVKRRGEDKD